VFISADSTISADATGRGDGGRIIITAGDYTGVHGVLTARGGPAGGNGGFVETSGGKLELTLAPDVSAVAGQAGTWLLDPHDVRIAPAEGVPWSPNNAASNGFGSQVGSDGTWNTWNIWPAASATGVSSLPIETIMIGLMHASQVIVQTSPGGTGKGDITWDMGSTWRLNLDTLGSADCPIGVGRKLILMANHDITVNFNAGIQTEQSATGSFQLVMMPNFDGRGGGQVHFSGLDLPVRTTRGPIPAVPPDAPERSLKDIVIVRQPAPANTVPPANSDVPDRSAGGANNTSEGDQSDNFKKDASASQVQIKLAESGALDATKAVSVRRVGAASRPALEAGDNVGMRTTRSRVP
jgi:hypothetical protein